MGRKRRRKRKMEEEEEEVENVMFEKDNDGGSQW